MILPLRPNDSHADESGQSYTNGSPNFGTTVTRSAGVRLACRNVRIWQDASMGAGWFVEPLPSEINETEWSDAPLAVEKSFLHLGEGVKLTQWIGETAQIERK